jgi:hypothetical protein
MRQVKAFLIASVALASGALGPRAHGAQPLPEGHPPVASTTSPGEGATTDDPSQPPTDIERQDPSLPAGTIAVEVRGGDETPIVQQTVNLGILINSIAKGDTHKHLQNVTDNRGLAVFSGLETLSNIAYRVSVGYEGGSFAAMPFQIPEGTAMRVVLHIYPVTRDIGSAIVASQITVEAEPRDDRMHVEEAVTIYNLGRTAWQPDDIQIALPPGYTAFGAQQSMSDQGFDEGNGKVTLRGTFPPGEHSLEFHWQLPMSGDKDVDFDIGLPPHVAMARLVVPAAPGIHLVAPDFPPTQLLKNSHGQGFLVTERRLRFDDPQLRSISMGVHDLPTPGPGRIVATTLAAIAVLYGLVTASSRRLRYADAAVPHGPDATGPLRTSLLEEIVAIERAYADGTIGPRTYERTRRELIDALALTLTPSPKS